MREHVRSFLRLSSTRNIRVLMDGYDRAGAWNMIGDGSLQYSVQSLYTAAQHKLRLIYIVPCNDEYAILKVFAVLEKTPNVPALDLPGLNIVTTAKAFGCCGVAASTIEEVKEAFKAALGADGPTLIAIPIARQLRPLVTEN